MASSLNHPHILTVHDIGELDGRQYLVTEYIDGGTLKDWASGGKRTWREIVELLVGVADGLATAHAAGILHRDIKPENILITTTGYAKLADFGLAKVADVASPDAATRPEGATRPGVVVGTIAYMSPEQASGGPLDARSDIFSFGVVLYEMLARRKPFAAATELELLHTIIHGKPRPLGNDVFPGLRAVVEKALENDPRDRYQSMREMRGGSASSHPAERGDPFTCGAGSGTRLEADRRCSRPHRDPGGDPWDLAMDASIRAARIALGVGAADELPRFRDPTRALFRRAHADVHPRAELVHHDRAGLREAAAGRRAKAVD